MAKVTSKKTKKILVLRRKLFGRIDSFFSSFLSMNHLERKTFIQHLPDYSEQRKRFFFFQWNVLSPSEKVECRKFDLQIQCPWVNRITLGHHKIDNNNRMIKLTDVFCALLRYRWASNFCLQ